jgi:hypothetical protein
LKINSFPSFEIPKGVTLPNCHKVSGVITFCAVAAVILIIQVISKANFFMVVNINGIKIQKYSHKKTAQLLSGF